MMYNTGSGQSVLTRRKAMQQHWKRNFIYMRWNALFRFAAGYFLDKTGSIRAYWQRGEAHGYDQSSRAGDTMALEKPVMGTRVPAPARLAMLSNTPRPVSSEARKIRVMDVQIPASSLLAPRHKTGSIRAYWQRGEAHGYDQSAVQSIRQRQGQALSAVAGPPVLKAVPQGIK